VIVEDLGWGLSSEGLAGTVVESEGDGFEAPSGPAGQIGPFREVLAPMSEIRGVRAVTPQIGQYWTLLTSVGHLGHAGLVACARPVAAATAPPHGTALPVTQGALVPQSGQVASRDQGNPLSSRRLSRHEAEHQTGCLVAEPSAVVGTARLAPRWSASWATPSPRASAPVVPRTCAQHLAPGRAHEPRMV